MNQPSISSMSPTGLAKVFSWRKNALQLRPNPRPRREWKNGSPFAPTPAFEFSFDQAAVAVGPAPVLGKTRKKIAFPPPQLDRNSGNLKWGAGTFPPPVLFITAGSTNGPVFPSSGLR